MAKSYFVRSRDDSKKASGPFTRQQIKKLVSNNKIKPHHQVSTNQSKWVVVSEAFPSLFPPGESTDDVKATNEVSDQSEKLARLDSRRIYKPSGRIGNVWLTAVYALPAAVVVWIGIFFFMILGRIGVAGVFYFSLVVPKVLARLLPSGEGDELVATFVAGMILVVPLAQYWIAGIGVSRTASAVTRFVSDHVKNRNLDFASILAALLGLSVLPIGYFLLGVTHLGAVPILKASDSLSETSFLYQTLFHLALVGGAIVGAFLVRSVSANKPYCESCKDYVKDSAEINFRKSPDKLIEMINNDDFEGIKQLKTCNPNGKFTSVAIKRCDKRCLVFVEIKENQKDEQETQGASINVSTLKFSGLVEKEFGRELLDSLLIADQRAVKGAHLLL